MGLITLLRGFKSDLRYKECGAELEDWSALYVHRTEAHRVDLTDSRYATDFLPNPEDGRDIIDEEIALSYGRDQLKSCEYVHFQKCVVPPHPLLPTRIIFVGDTDDEVRLVAQDPDDPTYAPYVCLSHCWGESQPLRTLTTNFSSHLKHIPWAQIPKTFQDAIRYARGLQLWYIWIDSLCIIQDSPQDWQTESAKMADIYQNARVTLAASASRNSRSGLYHPPGIPSIPYGTIHYDRVSIGIRRLPRHPVYRRTDKGIEANNASFPLFTRAWVFQERLLSPRIIHFGAHEMFWECAQDAVCVCDRHRNEMSDWELLENQALSTKLAITEKLGMRDASAEMLGALWRDLVEEYSQLRLTQSGDKLPAITGLAKVMEDRRWEEEYAAGVWTGAKMDLLWVARTETDYGNAGEEVTTYPRAGYRTTGWRAPSWSWASVDAEIVWALSSKAGQGTFDEKSVLGEFLFESEFLMGKLKDRLKGVHRGKHGKDGVPTLKLTGQIAPGKVYVDIPTRGRDTWLQIKTDEGGVVWSRLPTREEWTDKYNYVQIDDPEDVVKLRRRGSATLRVTCMRMAIGSRRSPYGHGLAESSEYTLILVETKPASRKYRRVGAAIRILSSRGYALFSDGWAPSLFMAGEEREESEKTTLFIV
ncbi:heterokaryon incompatibility protein-domain-containing protein [Staphylotrichum tortipilum]|uniref:Heterokaryon incompatibility protein-domain-containing protein n=1 Tax=Staphylotrichum tortipilum TaxID=2831512 RepID=A0AAN6MS00_9PEZI|nr:heterokaryon incompatibility protein-domain-containing protein [Staphylotrichum longicolle]